MDIHEIYQEDNKFEGEESIYYVLVGKGDSSRWDKSHKYYIITRSAVAIYDINAASMVKKIKVMTWPIPNEEHDAQEKTADILTDLKRVSFIRWQEDYSIVTSENLHFCTSERFWKKMHPEQSLIKIRKSIWHQLS